MLTPEGAFAIPNVPDGPVKFCVTSPNPDPALARPIDNPQAQDDRAETPPQPALPPNAWFAIPERYAHPEQSGLSGTVNGPTIINLELQ